MIKIHNLSYSYPHSDFRLEIDSLIIEEGRKIAVIGPSGFGKTTMLSLIAGILTPQKGEVIVNALKVNSLSDRDRRNFRITEIGFVFQDFRLLEYLNVLDNILLPFRINAVLEITAEVKQKAREIAESLNIAGKLSRHPSKLSHGERQRVAIGRALLHNPTILLADEPTGNLDPENKTHIMKLLFGYVANRNATLVTVTHDHELLQGFDRVVDFKGFQPK